MPMSEGGIIILILQTNRKQIVKSLVQSPLVAQAGLEATPSSSSHAYTHRASILSKAVDGQVNWRQTGLLY